MELRFERSLIRIRHRCSCTNRGRRWRKGRRKNNRKKEGLSDKGIDQARWLPIVPTTDRQSPFPVYSISCTRVRRKLIRTTNRHRRCVSKLGLKNESRGRKTCRANESWCRKSSLFARHAKRHSFVFKDTLIIV